MNTRDIIERYNFNIRKDYGQNFLTDDNILDKIVECAGVSKDDLVIEIGPGLGSMTTRLCQVAGEVLAIEIDKALIPILNETLAECPNIEVINADILKLDLKNEIQTRQKRRHVKVVANLPYYITTPIIMGLLEMDAGIESITVMVQKEVADRMQVGPGTKDYGALSLAVQYYSKPRIMINVPPECFMPRPKVGSAVIRLDIYKEPPVAAKDPEFMFKVIRAAFNQRRKTLVNALSHGMSLDKPVIEEALVSLGLSPGIRGEALTLEQFTQLSNVLGDK